jgi:hypothetical protein
VDLPLVKAGVILTVKVGKEAETGSDLWTRQNRWHNRFAMPGMIF